MHPVIVMDEVTDRVKPKLKDLTGRLWHVYVYNDNDVKRIDGKNFYRLTTIAWLSQNELTDDQCELVDNDMYKSRYRIMSEESLLTCERDELFLWDEEDFPEMDNNLSYEDNWQKIVDYVAADAFNLYPDYTAEADLWCTASWSKH